MNIFSKFIITMACLGFILICVVIAAYSYERQHPRSNQLTFLIGVASIFIILSLVDMFNVETVP